MCKKGQQELHRKFTQFSGFAWFKNSKISANSINILFSIICSIFLILLCFPLFSEAKVTGVCSNCHTMHNSQNGQAVCYDFDGTDFSKTTTPKGNLLIYSCLGCHSATDGTTWKDSFTNAPIVFNTFPPQYGASSDGGTTYQGLAGGNFYWVKTADTKGHNIFADNPDSLSPAPGDMGFSGCGTNNCHKNFDQPFSGIPELTGRQGCTKCHMVSNSGETSGFHHADDGTGTKYVDSAAKGWYRFLSGHQSGDSYGVKGIEAEDWQYTNSASDHNEYLGYHDEDVGYGFSALDHTTTAFCTGCHSNFHNLLGGPSPWLRHPSDARLPASWEYTAYTTYDPLIPVARPDGFDWGGGPIDTVSPGTDMVMCLSCHRAHGSPYFKMMRWDYKGESSTLSEALSGCNKCHTSKN
jgi:hypothetical protein